MKNLKFSETELAQMVNVQGEITKAVLPFKENTEAALVIFALVRAAKILLGLYSPQSRAELVEVIVWFLANDGRVLPASRPGLLDRFLQH